MCGRYALITTAEELVEEFQILDPAPFLPRRYNIAPTQTAPTVRVTYDAPRTQLALLRWGLIPSWSRDPTAAARMINARSETAATRPAFRSALRSRRCLVPCSGFYEWKPIGGAKRPAKQPYFITRAGGGLLALAGLWERWCDAAGELIDTYTILTTTPNGLMASLHDRMPAILDRRDYARWLDPSFGDVEALTALLRPCPDDALAATPVSTYVNNPRHDDPGCIAPAGGGDS